MNSRFIQQAIERARLSDHKQKVGCLIFDKKKIISIGYNQCQRSAKKLHPRFQKWPGSIHAEVDAIIRARRNLKGTNMIVVRINQKGDFRLAKPCSHCLEYINVVGIKKVIYSTSIFPFFEELNLNRR